MQISPPQPSTLDKFFSLRDRHLQLVSRSSSERLSWSRCNLLVKNDEKTLSETGTVWEQIVEIVHEGEPFRCRRVVLKLSRPTREQEWEIAIFTNLPPTDANKILAAILNSERFDDVSAITRIIKIC